MNNNKLKSLLVAAALLCAQTFSAGSQASWESGRTNMFADDVAVSTRWNRSFDPLMEASKPDDAADVTVFAHGVWQQVAKSRSGAELAKGLMFGANGSVVNTNGSTGVVDKGLESGLWNIDSLVLRAGKNTGAGADATLNVTDVEHRRLAGSVGLGYDASRFYEGLCMGVELNVVNERNKVNYTTSGADAAVLSDYVSGKTVAAAATTVNGVTSYTSTLNVLKMDNAQHSATAVSDVALMLGLRIVQNDTAWVKVWLRGSIPTAKERSKAYLFDANPGNRQGKVGAGLCACLNLVNDEAYAVKLHLGGDAAYVIKRNGENMIPSLNAAGPAWLRLARQGANTAPVASVAPLANYLAAAKMDLGNYVELGGCAKLSMERGAVSGNVGYNMAWSGEQTNTVKSNLADRTWFVATQNNHEISTTVGANVTPVAAGAVEVTDSSSFISKEGSKLRHGVSANVDFVTTTLDWPIQVGVGGAYEFAQNRLVSAERWSVGVRGGISF